MLVQFHLHRSATDTVIHHPQRRLPQYAVLVYFATVAEKVHLSCKGQFDLQPGGTLFNGCSMGMANEPATL